MISELFYKSESHLDPMLLIGFAVAAVLLIVCLVSRWRLERRGSPDSALFKKFFESAFVGNAISDFSKKWVRVNDGLCRMLGYTKDEMLSMTWAEMTHPDDLKLDVSHFTDMLVGKTDGYSIDKRFIRKGGEPLRINLSVSCIRRRGRITHILASVLDISRMYEAQSRIRELSQALLRSQEKERQIISRDLHDSFAQNLSSLKLGLQSIFHDVGELRKEQRGRLLDMMEILQQTIQGIRDLSSALRPQGLMQLGLSRTVESYCERFAAQNGIPVHFSSVGLARNSLSEDIQINCYRIVQEALSNALRHAAKPDGFQIWIKLAVSYPEFILRIEDDGQGFDVQALESRQYNNKNHNMGIRNMEERTGLLGGALQVNSEPGRGTRILIRIPISGEIRE